VALVEQLTKGTGPFRVLGVAGRWLFQSPDALNLFSEYMPMSSVTVRAILLDPESAWADVRDGLEQGHVTRDEISTSLRYLQWMRGQWGATRVDYRTTDVPLPASVVITDEWAFVEAYPIAEVIGPLGGRTPLLKLRAGSSGYKIWSDTFELLWKYPKLDALRDHARTLAP
jgi:hypothetical protein